MRIMDHVTMRVLRFKQLNDRKGELSFLKTFLPEPRETGDNGAHPLESSSENQQ